MSIILDPLEAFNSGQSLWILPASPESFWYHRLNWITNFRLSENEIRTRPKFHPWLVKLMESCEMPPPEIPISEPLLVPISQWLPAEWLVTIPYSSLQDSLFVKKMATVWKQLQHPTLRVFIPYKMSLQRWESLWLENKGTQNISLVLDPNSN